MESEDAIHSVQPLLPTPTLPFETTPPSYALLRRLPMLCISVAQTLCTSYGMSGMGREGTGVDGRLTACSAAGLLLFCAVVLPGWVRRPSGGCILLALAAFQETKK